MSSFSVCVCWRRKIGHYTHRQNSSLLRSAKGNGKQALVAAADCTLRSGSVPFLRSVLQPEKMRLCLLSELSKSFVVSRRL